MTTQPTALRLAEILEEASFPEAYTASAAAELRRLHQFAEDQIGRATAAEAALQMTKATHALKIAAVEAQRDALLEAAKEAEPMLQSMLDNIRNTLPQYTKMPALDKLSAAIKAVEEGK